MYRCCVGMLASALFGKALAENSFLTVLHVNDHHSRLATTTFKYSIPDNITLTTKHADGSNITEVTIRNGGFPRMIELFHTTEKTERNNFPNRALIKAHLGDAETGSIYYSFTHGISDALMMREICFDHFVLGNHEFDDGDIALAAFLRNLTQLNQTHHCCKDGKRCVPQVLTANLQPAPTSPLKQLFEDNTIKPYEVRHYPHLGDVAFIGIDVAQKTMKSSRPMRGTVLFDELASSKKALEEINIRYPHVNKVVLLTHYGYEAGMVMVKQLSQVDLLVGGDSHTLLGSKTQFSPMNFHPEGDYPTMTTNADNKTVCVVQAWEYSQVLGKVTVEFNEDGDVVSCGGKPLMGFDPTVAFWVDSDENKTQRTLHGNHSDMQTIIQSLIASSKNVLVPIGEDTRGKEIMDEMNALFVKPREIDKKMDAHA
eukprot:GEMP01010752.1.p1 GENE.GEMP01010752.1~~GEMP01010752.1.p1  ORF type:complete len:427 (+),score=98.17 GEMP01010752.1:10-1290(+)